MPWCCTTKTLLYFWPWCLVLPFWSLDSVCFCGLAADRGSSFHVWTSGGCSSSWTVSNTTFYTMFSSLQIIRQFQQYCSVHLLCVASTECITVNFCMWKYTSCVSCRTSTSHFGIVIWINFLVSLCCCESILYFTNKWNTCWNEYNSNILWKWSTLLFQVISFVLLAFKQFFIWDLHRVVYFSLIRKIDFTSVLIISTKLRWCCTSQSKKKKNVLKVLRNLQSTCFSCHHLSALDILAASSTLTFSQ